MDEIIQRLIDRHEAFKLKGMQLTVEDLFEWTCLQDEIIATVSNIKSENIERNAEMETKRNLRTIELKNQK